MPNITEVVGKQINLTSMSRGMSASGMNEFLSSGGPYTVFAPSDMAFGKMERGSFEELLKPQNNAELTSLIRHHIVAGNLPFKDLKNGDTLQSLDGKELKVTQNLGKTSVNGAIIQFRDVETSNGTIHSLDKIL